MRQGAWAAGVFVVVLGAALLGTWRDGTPRFEGSDAHAAPRIEMRGTRPESAEPLFPASDVTTPAPPAPPLPRDRPRAATEHYPAEVIIVDPGIEGDAPPLPPPALSLEDLFPPLPRSGAAAPCFDQLQGVRGVSPCPGATPRGEP